jgi:hypothetical protein
LRIGEDCMDMSEMRSMVGRPAYLSPTIGANGAWGSAGAHALVAELRQRSPSGVMGLFKAMDAPGMAKVLEEAGFRLSDRAVMQGRTAVYAEVKGDLERALQAGVDGWELRSARQAVRAVPAAAMIRDPARAAAEGTGSKPAPANALSAVREIFGSASVRVLPLGGEPLHERASLQMIAAQALQKGVLGFGFDGLNGKFDVPSPMSEVVELHRAAASAVATESARAALVEWAAGAKVSGVSEWVPDSVQRLLHGSVSLKAAQVLVTGVESGALAQHARNIGGHGIAKLLQDRGLDPTAPTIDQLAVEQEVTLIEPDRSRGQYFGTVVGQDHRASLLKVNRMHALEVPHSAMDERPKVGSQLRLAFKGGALTVSKPERAGREAVAI